MNAIEVVNPANEEVIALIETDVKSTLLQKFDLLKSGQSRWQEVGLTKRISVIKKYADHLKENIEELAHTLTSEVGKPLQQSRNEINGSIARIMWMIDHAEKYLTEETMGLAPGVKEIIRYEPLGIVCNISAWNYPYLVGTNVFIPALLAGNAVLYKPSEFAMLTGIQIESHLNKAGIPNDIFQVAKGGASIGEMLLELPFDGYFFTGSYKTGKYIYEKVAHKMVPCQCELGGKDPLYVTDDIKDIESIAAGTADGAFYNNGQSCCAVERIYVHEKVYDHYVEAFVKEVSSWKIGDPQEEGTYIGPLTRSNQINFIADQVKDALSKGAVLMTGGKRISQKGYFFEPTVITEVSHEMNLMREESFGPIIGIMKVKNDEEAILLMKDTEYGLTAAVYSTDQQRAERILSKIDTGTGYWNCCDRVSPALPWSGRKHSGFGTTLSHAGIRAFTKPKAYHLKG